MAITLPIPVQAPMITTMLSGVRLRGFALLILDMMWVTTMATRNMKARKENTEYAVQKLINIKYIYLINKERSNIVITPSINNLFLGLPSRKYFQGWETKEILKNIPLKTLNWWECHQFSPLLMKGTMDKTTIKEFCWYLLIVLMCLLFQLKSVFVYW